jgi:hypothetical protein
VDALAAIEAGCARLLVKRMIMSSFGELGGTSAAAAYIEAGYKANAGNKASRAAGSTRPRLKLAATRSATTMSGAMRTAMLG